MEEGKEGRQVGEWMAHSSRKAESGGFLGIRSQQGLVSRDNGGRRRNKPVQTQLWHDGQEADPREEKYHQWKADGRKEAQVSGTMQFKQEGGTQSQALWLDSCQWSKQTGGGIPAQNPYHTFERVPLGVDTKMSSRIAMATIQLVW